MNPSRRMIAAKEDSYKNIYADGGSYTYPRLPENKLKVKGDLYSKA